MPINGLIPTTVLQRLKSATKSLHVRLDQHLAIARVNAGIADYLEHIQLSNRWLNEVNARLIFRREHALKKAYSLNNYFLDLMFIDFKASSSMVDFQDGHLEARFKPEISVAFFWGIDYVVKGSALGARHLYQSLALTLPDQPLYYFHEASTHGIDRWLEFSLEIEAAITNELDLKAAESGAIWAFETMIALNLKSLPTPTIIRQS